MTIKDIPIIPTLIVAAAIATMIALGFWQLDRKEEKEAMIARYGASGGIAELVAYPADGPVDDELLYRRTRVTCESVTGVTTVAGVSASGAKGVAERANCLVAGGRTLTVDIGFARDPRPVDWSGGEVTGVIAPGGRIVSETGLAGLEPLARPDPASLPNNHLAYAGQWFFFALTALVIYILALRRRGRGA